ncbi:MAG: exodeoxyribonuclease III [Deltaproteobacteria bacterium]|nr:exodeoxyribonuclease III [Deltaproteobacteria bacterium]
MRIATWNVNSLRARQDQVLDWIEANRPDVVCMQETKLVDREFPEDELGDLGYDVVYTGEPAYNGVAIATKDEATRVVRALPGDPSGQKRYLAVDVRGIRVHNVYCPNGAELDSDKFFYKLEWFGHLHRHLQTSHTPDDAFVVCGDFNVAPEDLDAFDASAFSLFVSPRERDAIRKLLDLGTVDVFRALHPEERAFTWWDYRANGFAKNAGLRIDLFLASKTIVDRARRIYIDVAERRKEKTSDHAPVVLDLA